MFAYYPAYPPYTCPGYYIFVPSVVTTPASSFAQSFTSWSIPNTPDIPQRPWPSPPPTVPLPPGSSFASNERCNHASATLKDTSKTAKVAPLLRYPPSVHPLIAFPSLGLYSGVPFVWDVLYPPHKLRVAAAALCYPSTPIISWTEFALPAAQAALPDGGHPLCSLFLIFPHLSINFKITPSAGGSPAGDHRYVSVWDVLLGLYNGLRMPITPAALADMATADQRGLGRSATRRRELLPSDRGSSSIRKVDFLGRRRTFLGIRPAQPGEVPLGKRLGEVFVVDFAFGSG